MINMDMKKEYDVCREMVENKLKTYFQYDLPQQHLFQAMRYSLLAGGKRIRPVLVLKFAEASGGNMEAALPFACAVEMLHTYSLIHDDLPCMDDDDLRRGKPTNHKVYGECTAVLAGDALQTAAFDTLLNSDGDAETVLKAARVLSLAAGERGMCGGQILDIDGENTELSIYDVENIHKLKTAAMIKAAAMIGVISGGGTEKQLSAAEKYADAVGLAFQIRDDILDATSTPEELGKPIGSDAANGKNTFLTLLGIEKCEEIIINKTNEAKEAVRENFENSEFLCYLADSLVKRKS